MPATFSSADSASSSSRSHTRQRGVYTRRKRRRTFSFLPRLGNKAVLGVLGALGAAFVASLLIIVVNLLG